ncbi:Hsp20/alpha crystallin family protein [Candidatus Peregrinibacteria bacterium]|nr:Hsp20/alpha crystallin family protein [Candidatus Peregrinibacteria bacterium]
MKTLFIHRSATAPIKASRDFEKVELKEPGDVPSGFGQLPIDILENQTEILIIAPLAGVDFSEAEVVINNDVLTIRGRREMDEDMMGFKKKDYFLQECFWGEFSRSVILPPNADSQVIEATQNNHILYIRIPKRNTVQMRIVKIKSR